MTRINLFRNLHIRKTADRNAASKANSIGAKIHFENGGGALVFGALLIVCSIAVGCSSDKPKPVSSTSQSSGIQSPGTTLASSAAPAAPAPAETKPAPKKVVKKRPATVTYVDKTYGVSFEYPRRYAIETGAAATDLADSNPLPTNFVAPGGTALVAVELPETGFANTDFSSAFFGVSVNKSLSAEDCGKFAVPQGGEVKSASVPAISASAPQSSAPAESTASTPAQAAPEQTANENVTAAEARSDAPKSIEAPKTTEATNSPEPKANTSEDAKANVPEDAKADNAAPSIIPAPKVMLSGMDVQKTEAVTGEGNRQSDSKYFHVYQNDACYEFALNVTTVASQSDGEMKHIDRDKVFAKLEKILATVKINPVEAEKEATTAPAPVPAQ